MEEHPSRAMWRLYEPLHSFIYYYPPFAARNKELGFKGGWMGYFASRSAALGQAGTSLVESVFYHFSPALIRRAIPYAWQQARPEKVLVARNEVAEELVGRSMEVSLSKSDGSFLCEILLEIACTLGKGSRPLYSANLEIDWTRSPSLSVFGAATLLREHRGDTHNLLLAANSIDGVQSHLLQAGFGTVDPAAALSNRGWEQSDWEAATSDLVARGILKGGLDLKLPELTPVGFELKTRIENLTDELSDPFSKLPAERLERIRKTAQALSVQLRSDSGFPNLGPMGI